MGGVFAGVIKKMIYGLFLLVVTLIVGLPIYYLLVTTFKTPADVVAAPLALPSEWNFEGYIKAFNAMNYFQSLGNNLIITIVSVLLLVVFASMAAYAITRSKKRYLKTVSSIFLVGLIIPYQISIIPLYKLLGAFELINTHAAVILVDVFCGNLAMSIFLIRGFINTIPQELESAAAIDGCGTFQCFWRIVFPLLKPVISTIVILDTLSIWNDFLTPLLMLQSPEKQVLIQQVYRNIGPFSTDWTSLFTMLVLATLPLVIFYLFMQKKIIEGVAAGAIKG